MITSPIAAATPIRGVAIVTERMMNALRTPPSQSHAGWCADAEIPARLRRAISSTATPVAPATRVEKPSASTVPTRSPSLPRIAACAEAANPAEIETKTASAVPPDTVQP